MNKQDRDILIRLLGDIRSGMVAEEFKGPVKPTLEIAEVRLMTLLFPIEEINEYLIANGRRPVNVGPEHDRTYNAAMRDMGFSCHEPRDEDDQVRWSWNRDVLQIDVCSAGARGYIGEILYWEDGDYGRDLLTWDDFCEAYGYKDTPMEAARAALKHLLKVFVPIITNVKEMLEA